MWGRITPGQASTHEEHATPITGLIQIATLEAVRASKASAERASVPGRVPARSDEITAEAMLSGSADPEPLYARGFSRN